MPVQNVQRGEKHDVPPLRSRAMRRRPMKTTPIEIACPCGARIRHCDACGTRLEGWHTLLNGIAVDCIACGGTRVDRCQACGADVGDVARVASD